MQQYADVVTDLHGNVVPRAIVSIFNLDGSLASLFAPNESTPIDNPVVADDRGTFTFKAANGNYTRSVTASGITTVIPGQIVLTNGAGGGGGTAPTTASAVANVPSGSLGATTVQGALNELDTEKASVIQLAGAGGAGQVGTSDGSTVQAKLTAFAASIAANISAIATKISTAALAAAAGSSLVGFVQALTGFKTRTVQDKLREQMITLTDFSTIVADGTDQTAAIVAWLGTLSAGYDGLIRAPYGLAFNADQVYDALPLRAILVDESGINSWNTTGSRARVVTMAAERGDSTAVVDMTTILASSGHNACATLDNRGTAGSNSALGLVAAIQWCSGRLKKGQAGLRQIARFEWAKLDGTNSWVWVMRKFVPWAARNWEYWYASTAYAAGATILTNAGRTYSTTLGGTSGTVEPSHTSGTATDGTITWAYLQASNDQSLFVVNENGELSTNTTPLPGYVAYLKAGADSDGAAIIAAEATGVSKYAALFLKPTNGSAAVISALPGLYAMSDGTFCMRPSGSGVNLFQASNTSGFQLGIYGHTEATAADGAATPDVSNCGLLILANTASTNVTGLANGAATQEVTLFFQNANTTLVHNGGSFILKGGVNVTPAANTMIVMKRYSSSGAWFEKSRSF